MSDNWKEPSAYNSSSHHSRKWSAFVLLFSALLSFAQALPLVHPVQERSPSPFKGTYNYSSSLSLDNPCLANATALEYGWDVYCPSHPQVCVSATWRCNGIVDCDGLEDELNCSSSEGRSFECMFGNVTIYLANDRMCNGQMDCPDGSDEDTECDCQDGFQSCDNLCFPVSWWCDSEVDCADGSDENNCMPSKTTEEEEGKLEKHVHARSSEEKGEEGEREEESGESNGEEGNRRGGEGDVAGKGEDTNGVDQTNFPDNEY